MAEKMRLPIHLTLEIKRNPPPNQGWYDVTGVLSWPEAGYKQRMDTAMCWQDEVPSLIEAIRFLVEETFSIQTVTERGDSYHPTQEDV